MIVPRGEAVDPAVVGVDEAVVVEILLTQWERVVRHVIALHPRQANVIRGSQTGVPTGTITKVGRLGKKLQRPPLTAFGFWGFSVSGGGYPKSLSFPIRLPIMIFRMV